MLVGVVYFIDLHLIVSVFQCFMSLIRTTMYSELFRDNYTLLCLYLPPILSLCDQTTLSFYPIYLHLTDSLAKRVTIAEPTQQKVSLNDLGY